MATDIKVTNEAIGEERKKLIDMETNIKMSLKQLRDVLNYVGEIHADDDTWELAHYVYEAVESCDKALLKVFHKEKCLEFSCIQSWDNPFSNRETRGITNGEVK